MNEVAAMSADFTRCQDRKCPQKLTCARWTRREEAGAILHMATLREPGECRCRPCRAWLKAEQNEGGANG